MVAFALWSGPVPSVAPERKVAVVGGGVAGLATAVVLGKRASELAISSIDLYEPRLSLDQNLGGAVNLNGGAAILAKRYGMERALWEAASPFNQVTGYSSSGGQLFQIDVNRELSKRPDKDKLMHNNRPQLMTIMRDDLMQVLDGGLDRDLVTVYRGKKVAKVVPGNIPRTKRLELSNGKTCEVDYDLVIGADGLKSATRKFVAPDASPAEYSGIKIQFAVGAPGPGRPDLRYGDVQQHFGDGGFVLRYAAGLQDTRRDLVVFPYVSSEKRDENEEYQEEDLRQDCMRRLKRVGLDGPLVAMVNDAERMIEVGVYFHKPLQSWSSEQVVLLGDSCHALPPFLGQGANQAIQDAHALANAISATDSLKEAAATYEAERKPVTTAILQASRFVGALETANGIRAPARNALFRFANTIGAPSRAFLSAAMPAVDI